MRLVTASHITDWATRNRRDCQGFLPLLIRRLIRATADRIDRIDFPVGDAVSDEGWDGRVTCASRHPFVPDGVSGWEIGTERSAPGKAVSDYKKRLADPLDLDAPATAFVFVTPRAWPRRHNWEHARRAEGRWRDVRVIAASGLEQWLEDAPAVASWLAHHLEIAPVDGIVGIEQWWERWTGSTNPVMTPAMLLAGRGPEATEVEEWFAGARETRLEVQGDSIDESIAFLRAAASTWPEATQDAILSRCVVVETEQAFDAAATWKLPAVIAASADVARSARLAMQNGHRLFLAVGRTLASHGPGLLRLPRVDRHAFERALETTGMPREDAVAMVATCGGSLAVFHRQRLLVSTRRGPPWASPPDARALVPALLAGAWSEAVRPTDLGPFGASPPPLLDREVLCRLGRVSDYDAVAEPVRKYRSVGDAPFRQAADVWRLTAALDAWYLLADRLESADLTRLAETAFSVLSLTDPKYNLPDDEQWLAAVKGKQRSHSEWLREGLATSLAIVAQRGDELRLRMPHDTPEGFIGAVVRRIMEAACDWRGWASLADVLPILAEAAPSPFLAAVEGLVEDRPEAARELLSDGGGNAMMGECRHAGVLWALERLAWHPAHLLRATLALARLDNLDPSGRWSNRPFNTLCEILLGPGDPYTFASPDRCIEAIDALIRSTPSTAWRLLLKVAEPMRSRVVRDPPMHLAARPDGWMPWAPEQRIVFWDALISRMTSMIENAPEARIVEALGAVWLLPESAQSATCSWLEKRELTPVLSPNDPLWNGVRNALHRLRSFGPALKTAPGLESSLASIEAALAPMDPEIIAKWLFSGGQIQLPEGQTEDWQAYHERVRLARVEVVRLLLNRFGPYATVSWSEQLPDRSSFGVALASVATAEEDAALRSPILALAEAAAPHPPSLTSAYIHCRLDEAQWLDEWCAAASACADGAASAALCYALPFGPATWLRVSSLRSEAQQVYWRWASGLPSEDATADELEQAAERLLEAGRPWVVLNWVVLRRATLLHGQLLLRLAMELIPHLSAPDALLGGNLSWKIERLFECIDDAGLTDEDVARLEWAYLPLLLPHYSTRGPRRLHRLLACDPTLFVQLICWGWKRRDGLADVDDPSDVVEMTSEAVNTRSLAAHDLLDSWHGPLPGQTGQDIDSRELSLWIEEAKRLLEQAGRAQIGDTCVGKLLAHAPVDPGDGFWPHNAIREVLTLAALRGDSIDSGFITGVINKQGVTTRTLFEGGALERGLAGRYTDWADGMRAAAPRSARLLDKLAEHYRARGRDQDDSADLNRLR